MDLDEIFNNSFEKKVIDSNLVSQRIKECRDLVIDKFSDIEFIEEGHIYKIDETEYTSVSNIIKKYEPEVDWDQKAADYARKWGKKKEDVQKEWKLNNLKSTISGTRTHSFGESMVNLYCGYPELICEQNKPQYIKEYNVLIPTYPKEEAVVHFFDELEDNLHPVGAEFKLSSKYIENTLPICGTCDILFYNSNDDTFVLGDWKTNKSLIKEYSRYHKIMMTGCVSNMISEPISEYTIQFNLYQKMLESIGINISDRILIWLKDDGTYERIHIDKMSDSVINKIMRGLK